jgi:hypothetical protein
MPPGGVAPPSMVGRQHTDVGQAMTEHLYTLSDHGAVGAGDRCGEREPAEQLGVARISVRAGPPNAEQVFGSTNL